MRIFRIVRQFGIFRKLYTILIFLKMVLFCGQLVESGNYALDELLSYYDGRNSIDESHLDCAIKDFVVDNGLVTIWVYTK